MAGSQGGALGAAACDARPCKQQCTRVVAARGGWRWRCCCCWTTPPSSWRKAVVEVEEGEVVFRLSAIRSGGCWAGGVGGVRQTFGGRASWRPEQREAESGMRYAVRQPSDCSHLTQPTGPMGMPSKYQTTAQIDPCCWYREIILRSVARRIQEKWKAAAAATRVAPALAANAGQRHAAANDVETRTLNSSPAASRKVHAHVPGKRLSCATVAAIPITPSSTHRTSPPATTIEPSTAGPRKHTSPPSRPETFFWKEKTLQWVRGARKSYLTRGAAGERPASQSNHAPSIGTDETGCDVIRSLHASTG